MNDVDSVIAAHPQFRWKIQPGGGGEGIMAYAVVGVNKGTGELWVMAVIERCSALNHQHNLGGEYGEMIVTLAGELHDFDDEGRAVVHRPGDPPLFHAPGSVHAPGALFWVGLYHQPCGSSLVG